ncbi:hypothetical protein KEC54_24655 [Methylorubrum extorquens]|uniref:Right handed beta helix domain-containing protein n=1 Tax=Methylorubrum extorquens TaxID=408 RepID=A0AAX3WD26_METEX|nr:hypothetical protein [Methylorubrum extorquens]WHQ69492.1 hypothetical protein KEC54_24655 [Methylorubrum extorquens]
MITSLNLRFVLLLVLIILACYSHADPVLGRGQIDVTKNEFENLSCDGVTDDAHKIQRLIDIAPATADSVFVIPSQRTCVFTGRIFLRSNLTFKFHGGAAFAGGSWVYVSRSENSGDGPRNVRWIDCNFINKGKYITRTHVLIRAANVTFERCVWNRVFRKDTHVIDVGGSENIIINDNTFIGSHGDIRLANDITKEAVQVDYAWMLGMKIPESDLKASGTGLHVYNNAPSRNIVVRNSRFVPSYNPDGSIESYPPPPFGVHATTSECLRNLRMCIGDVRFEGNVVLDVVDVGVQRRNQGIIHFGLQGKINISGNTFQNIHTHNDYMVSVEVPDGKLDSVSIDVDKNRFMWSDPRVAVILIREGVALAKSEHLERMVRICDNDFYIDRLKGLPRLIDGHDRDAKIRRSDCGNRFSGLSHAPRVPRK